MPLSSKDLNTLLQDALKAAQDAGQLISSYGARIPKTQTKVAGDSLASQVLTEVDLLSEKLILDTLNHNIEKYNLGVLAEESHDDSSRFEKEFFWCIDPLDGTLPFTEGTSGYAVSIALVAQNGTPHIGVIYDPNKNQLYHAIKNGGAFLNHKPWHISPSQHLDNLTVICDRSFKKHQLFNPIIRELNEFGLINNLCKVNLIAHGGAAMNAIWAIENQPACYFKLPKKQDGGGSIWDYAATACIYRELGLFASDIQGEKLNLNNKQSTFMNKKGILFSSSKTLKEFIIQLNIKL